VLIPDDHIDDSPAIMQRLRRGERVEHYETVRLARDGRRIDVSLTVSPVRNAEGRIIGASKIARDISERKRLIEQLRDQDRLKDDFLATLAHELRNPLAPIRTGVQLIRRAGHSPALLEKACPMMERQLEQMVRLIDDLLDVSRISRDKLELRKGWVELATVVQSAVETSRPLIEAASHTLTVSLPQEPILLDADAVRLAQAFSNLLNNAAKYTDRGGHISLTAESTGNGTPGEAVVRVRDTGVGIPADKLPHIFEMFVQADRSERAQGGLGIGLTLARRLIQLHGGTLSASSAGPGAGSEFTVRLPVVLVPASPSSGARGTGAGAVRARARRRILVADDNRDSAEMLATSLELQGHDVATAHDGEHAVALVETFQPDVAFLDLGMPKVDGYSAARRIREEPWGRSVLLVAVTGWGQDDDKRRSRQAGFDAHLVKPVDLAEIETLLGGLSDGLALDALT
jgi:signal transduction histidine kinase/ActR/RegA family two-component response regulator